MEFTTSGSIKNGQKKANIGLIHYTGCIVGGPVTSDGSYSFRALAPEKKEFKKNFWSRIKDTLSEWI